MSNVLRLAIVDPSDQTRDQLKSMLLGLDKIWLDAECSRYEFFADVVAQTNPDIGVVALDHNADKALELVTRLCELAPECSILVVSSSADGGLILRAMRAGAKEFLARPVRIEDLLAALERITKGRSGRGDGKTRTASVIAVAGATGGVGSTCVAVNLGCILAKNEQNSPVLVDLDLALGDADVFLDTIPDYTLVDVAQNVTRLDFSLLKRSLTRHSSGLFLLPRPMQMEDMSLISPDDLSRVMGLMKAAFTHLVIDLSKGYSAIDMMALQMADHILLVTQLDLPCLRNVVRLIASFESMEGVGPKVKIVVNRVGLDGGQISLKKAQETVGRDIYWQLPNDYRTMIEVRNNGVPLIEQAPKAAITQALLSLSNALTGAGGPAPAADAGSKSGIQKLLGLWPGKAKQAT